MTLFGYRVPMMASLLVWCVVWEIVGRLDLVFLLPPFSEVLAAAVDLVQTPSWQSATVTTLRAFVIGMALSIVVGVPLGILMGRVKIADDLLGMWVNIFSSAPLSALVPVLMILFGFGEKTIVAAVFLFAIWIIVLDTRAGVRHISPSLIEMARSYGASPPRALRQDHPLGGAARNPRRHPARAHPRRQGRRHRPAARRHRRLRRAVRDLLAQLPHGRVLGAHHHPLRLRPGCRRTDRAGGGQSRILRRSKTMNMQDAHLELRHRADRHPGDSRWREPTSCFRCTGSIASAATMPRMPSRWDTIPTRSRRSSSRRTRTISIPAENFPIRRPRTTSITRSRWSWR